MYDTSDKIISGRVAAVVYYNDENGYAVLRLRTDDGAQVTATGCLPFVCPGEELTLTGEWQTHQTHGEQFKADAAERHMPSDEEAVYEYLAGGSVKGIGPATAAVIVSRFGVRALDVLENRSAELASIKGISLKRAEEMSKNFRKQTGLRRLIESLSSFGLRPVLAARLYKYYGDAAPGLLRENPYILALGVIGGTFAEADGLALSMGFEGDSPQRIASAILFELSHNSGNGHVFIPREKLVGATMQLIGAEREAVEEGLDVLSDEGDVVRETVAGQDACYLKHLHEAERSVAKRIAEMAEDGRRIAADTDLLVTEIEREQGIVYAKSQKEALAFASSSGVVAVTGGPGTGKTTCVRALLAMYDAVGLKSLITAPTGRAAKRMSELTGRAAATVHRLLEAGFSGDGIGVVFKRCAKEPLDCDAVILDECSMVDIELMNALLLAMSPGCRLVLVGDADQLPSVGPGNVFGDIIRSGTVPVVRLTEIFRQGEGSRIVESAHMINEGEHPDLQKNEGDMFFLRRREPDKAAETIVSLISERLPKNMGVPAKDVQVLTPTRKGPLGTAALNEALQGALNPPEKGKKEKSFGGVTLREGDKVMQIKNNYDIIWQTRAGEGEKAAPEDMGIGVYNGDIGYIERISEDDGVLYVNFDGRLALYGFEMLGELEHAWAVTVHKAQGSEYRAVVLSVGQSAPQLMYRGVLYTAVTRARELLIIVGDEAAVFRMTDDYRQTRRYSGLRARLCGEVGRSAADTLSRGEGSEPAPHV